MFLKKAILIAGVLFCSNTQAIAPEAERYLQTALDAMQYNFVYADKINWSNLRKTVAETAKNATTTAQTYPAIQQALNLLGEQHSFFLTPEQVNATGKGSNIGVLMLYTTKGYVVLRVYPNSPAARAGLLLGDVITMVNGQAITPEHTPVWSESTDRFEVVYQRRGETQNRSVVVERGQYSTNVPPTASALPNRIGYFELPTHFGNGSLGGGERYAELGHEAIRTVDTEPRCGWIVDLRRNMGGNMWPMLAAVGPIVGEGILGGFVKGETKLPWIYAKGAARQAEQTVDRALNFYKLQRPNPPVAVLTSQYTGSSGEALTLAFVGRANTRSFGEPTFGVPTSNQSFNLSDGAMLVLTVSLMMDRTGRSYSQPIQPDQAVDIDWFWLESERDPAMQAAQQWLRSQPACQQP